MATSADELREQVRRRYAEAATAASTGGCGCEEDGGCCGNAACDGEDGAFGEALYDAEQRGELPEAAALASLGCGNPTAVADLHEGDTVLDLGSGGGIDVILSAKRVGPTGIAYGLDMTDEMLALAQQNARDAGIANAHFLKGVIEQIPLPADSIDVVISNCVINLSVDKPAVLTEIARVLKPGGRIGISDVVAEDHLTLPRSGPSAAPTSGCIAGALSKGEYEAGLIAAGFEHVSVEFTHAVADGMHGAIVKAVKVHEAERTSLPDHPACITRRLSGDHGLARGALRLRPQRGAQPDGRRTLEVALTGPDPGALGGLGAGRRGQPERSRRRSRSSASTWRTSSPRR